MNKSDLAEQPMPTTIRSAASADAETLTRLCRFVHELHFDVRPDEFKPFEPAKVAAWFRTLLAAPTARIWIAASEGHDVGFVAATVHERAESPITRGRRWLEVDQLAVDPDFRRRGVARELILAAVEQARREGLATLQTTTWWFNSVARTAMAQLGFRSKVVRFERSTDELTAQPAE